MPENVKTHPPYSIIPQDHCAAIGQATVSWANLELTVDRAIWYAMQVDQQIAACLTSQLNSIFSRLNALISILREVGIDEKMCKRFGAFAGTCSALSEERNRLVHDARFLHSNGNIYKIHNTAKTIPRFEFNIEEITSLHNLHNRIMSKEQEFMNLWNEISGQLEVLLLKPKKRHRMIAFHDLERTSLTTAPIRHT